MFSSDKTTWETPQIFFEKLNQEFNFTCDVCALPENTKCQNYYTPEINGLKQEWTGTCWMNPPYGKEIADWLKKASESKCTTVCLVPARTDTKWFHNYVLNKAEIRFVKGRLKFVGAKNSAPFPSMIAIYRNEH